MKNNNMTLYNIFSLLILILSCSINYVDSFSSSPFAIISSSTNTRRGSTLIPTNRCSSAPKETRLLMSAGEAALPMPLEEEDDDEMEWVEEEFELLTERDFYNTEWKIGTLMDDKPRDAKSIDTTWARLVTTEAGENSALWGDGAKGKWTIDVPSQFFSISKESFGGWFGKQIWAGTIEDFYYLEGTVRGWSPLSPASVIGQWQAIRLGVVEGERVTVEERGEAPWFGSVEEKDEANNEKSDDIEAEMDDNSVGKDESEEDVSS